VKDPSIDAEKQQRVQIWTTPQASATFTQMHTGFTMQKLHGPFAASRIRHSRGTINDIDKFCIIGQPDEDRSSIVATWLDDQLVLSGNTLDIPVLSQNFARPESNNISNCLLRPSRSV